MPSRLISLARRFDRFQRERAWLAFPIAVMRKFGDDRGGSLAALIAYYGFFSVFPLLLVLVTILGWALQDGSLRERVLDSALAQFPVIGTQIRENVGELRGGAGALAIGLLGALWAGTGVVEATRSAMDEVWNVPNRERPGLLESRARSLLVLFGAGLAVLASTVIAGLGTSGDGLLGNLAWLGGSLVVDMGLLLFAFRVLTAEEVGWRDVFPGAAMGAIAWVVLQTMGGILVDRQIRGATDVYGLFAIVIGLLVWMYILAQVLIVAAEINVVRRRRLWPRSFLGLTPEVSSA